MTGYENLMPKSDTKWNGITEIGLWNWTLNSFLKSNFAQWSNNKVQTDFHMVCYYSVFSSSSLTSNTPKKILWHCIAMWVVLDFTFRSWMNIPFKNYEDATFLFRYQQGDDNMMMMTMMTMVMMLMMMMTMMMMTTTMMMMMMMTREWESSSEGGSLYM